ncbi:endonuclease/exonuclease/phosphatase family protein [Amorphoplanes digitatis]|uniref:Endonuclease/exonuclease/phosphatase family metal-dependent hydrolase n=1 Tax=Actinoplanes digitatis TaxID=1868 RepID=A0A7W7HT90_9ACTN|nr:endonuclease/exonuclease/phosphatase family protein [Actinoplanes digitatis]MBB4760351.1 endonuclease/exonuclease/phosphatase family metal-dependent hydrolase [Actinoplanes digitatis]
MKIAVVLAALLSGLLAVAPQAQARASPTTRAPAGTEVLPETTTETQGPPTVEVFTFNVCGNLCRHGEVALTAKHIAGQIRRRETSVAMLQELCYSQYLGIRRLLVKRGYSAVFARATTGGQCDNDDRRHGRGFGVAIVARGTLYGKVVRRLPSPHPGRQEPRVALGARLRVAGRPILVVTTHTAPSGPNLALQLATVQRWLEPIAAGRPVILGGDLNSPPDSLDLVPFATMFQEADGRAEPLPTFIPKWIKIDYLFGSRGFLTPRSATTACGDLSDHCLYVGSFAIPDQVGLTP